MILIAAFLRRDHAQQRQRHDAELEHEVRLPGESTIRLTVIATVLLSIIAHGTSVRPGIDLYARKVAALDRGEPEHKAS